MADQTEREAKAQAQIWLQHIGAEDSSLFAVRPKLARPATAVKDVEPNVAQNFAPTDATEQEGDWQIVDVTVNQPVETYQGTWAEADRIATQYETGMMPSEHEGHEISVRRA